MHGLVLRAFAPSQPEYPTLRNSENGSVWIEDQKNAGGGGRSAFAFVVPDFANPIGETLGKGARRRHLALAAEHDMRVIKDSPYEMLRFKGIVVSPLQALDVADTGGLQTSRVIHRGSLSKVFTPGLRVGWVYASREILGRIMLIKQRSDLYSPAINQRVMQHLARTIYDEQTERARNLYRRKRDATWAYRPGNGAALPGRSPS